MVYHFPKYVFGLGLGECKKAKVLLQDSVNNLIRYVLSYALTGAMWLLKM